MEVERLREPRSLRCPAAPISSTSSSLAMTGGFGRLLGNQALPIGGTAGGRSANKVKTEANAGGVRVSPFPSFDPPNALLQIGDKCGTSKFVWVRLAALTNKE